MTVAQRTATAHRIQLQLRRLKWYSNGPIVVLPDPLEPAGGVGKAGLPLDDEAKAAFLVQQHNESLVELVAIVLRVLEPLAPAEVEPVPKLDEAGVDWKLPMRYAAELPPCQECGEPWCPECEMHFYECRHPGPHSERPS